MSKLGNFVKARSSNNSTSREIMTNSPHMDSHRTRYQAGPATDHVEAFPNDVSKQLYTASCTYMSGVRFRRLASKYDSDCVDD